MSDAAAELAPAEQAALRYQQLLAGATPPHPDKMSEADLLAVVEHMCQLLRLRYYHTRNSRGSAPGFPDLVIVGNRVIYRELKTAKGSTTRTQDAWLSDLSRAGQDAAVWKPSDLRTSDVRSGRIWRELSALA